MNDRSLTFVAILATLAAGEVGCGKAKDGTPPEKSAAVPAASPVPARPAISENDAREFAANLEREVASGDSAAVARRFDWDAYLETAMVDIPASPGYRKGFVKGAKESLASEGGLTSRIVGAAKQGGGFKFLRVQSRGKRRTALFRLLMPNDGGLEYIDCILARRSDGAIRIVDTFSLSKSELASQSIRRLYLPGAEQSSRNLLERLTKSEQELVKNTPLMTRMVQQLQSGQYREALDTYRQFPPDMKKEKNFLFMRLQAAQNLGEKEYLEAIDDLLTAHPDDPCTDLLSIDYFTMKKQDDKALASIDRLDKAVGGDPYLHVLRGSLYLTAENLDAAKREMRKAIEQEPDLKVAYWNVVAITMQQHKFDETAAALTLIEKNLGIKFQDLTTVPDYAEFVKSPEYREWIASRHDAAKKKKVTDEGK